jgi:regulator of sirC expression with transglutaminase-like and TPR domain
MLPDADRLAADLVDAVERPGADLAHAALLVARLEYPALDPRPWLEAIGHLGEEALARVAAAGPADAPLHTRVEALNAFVYRERGFTGNRERYDDPRNSCLNQVLERRTGIPITLAILYVELARRAGLRAEGVNFPGHFLVRVDAEDGRDDGLLIDAFHDGAVLEERDCRVLLHKHLGDDAAFSPALLARAGRRQVIARMLLNLKRLYVRMRSFPQARLATHLLVALSPSSLTELRDRGLLAYHVDDLAAALRDLEEYLRLAGRGEEEDEDARKEQEQVWAHVKVLRRRLASFN